MLNITLDETNKTASKAAEILLGYKLYLYHAPVGSEFISSDNPGFTLLPNGQILTFGGFGLLFTFIFPLAPRCCLVISHKNIDENGLFLTKNIFPLYIPSNMVNEINKMSYSIAMDRIFSYSKRTLENLKI